jgi:hypothetical protein
MKKIILIASLITIVSQSYSQEKNDPNDFNSKEVRSKFSVGISPIVFVPINEYSEGPGVGLEMLGLYSLNKNFSVGGFAKIKTELNSSALENGPGGGYNNNEDVFQNVAGSVGAIFEYKVFNKIGFNVRLGYEDIVSEEAVEEYNYNPYSFGSNYNYSPTIVKVDNDPGFVYGGGVSLYVSRDESKSAVHSFNWGLTFESNNSTKVDVLDIGTNRFESTDINAFYIQFGWRVQFHSLKAKK